VTSGRREENKRRWERDTSTQSCNQCARAVDIAIAALYIDGIKRFAAIDACNKSRRGTSSSSRAAVIYGMMDTGESTSVMVAWRTSLFSWQVCVIIPAKCVFRTGKKLTSEINTNLVQFPYGYFLLIHFQPCNNRYILPACAHL